MAQITSGSKKRIKTAEKKTRVPLKSRLGRAAKPNTRPAEDAALRDIARIEARLDAEIPEAKKTMDELLTRLRTQRVASAA